MRCPSCPDATLSMSTREGIEIDYCPKCRGVWLDRGELDKIIERSASQAASASTTDPRSIPPRERPYYDDDERRKYGYGKRRKGFLGELFDFD